MQQCYLSTLNQQSCTINALTITIKRLERQTEILANQVASQQVTIETQSGGSLVSAIVSSLICAFSIGLNGQPTPMDTFGRQHHASSDTATVSHAPQDSAPAPHAPAQAHKDALKDGMHDHIAPNEALHERIPRRVRQRAR
jgi:hypothetical protein